MSDMRSNEEEWDARYYYLMWKMLEKALSNKEWLSREDPFTIALLAADCDFYKKMYEKRSNDES